jgi:hypothetical protein
VYSTYLGGSGDDEGFAIAVDRVGNAYIAGFTDSTNFPVTPDAFSPAYNGGASDGFVTKLNPTGGALVYSSYLGGVADDSANGIAIDYFENAYVVMRTNSANFPVTPGAPQPALAGGNDAFVTKIQTPPSVLSFTTGILINPLPTGQRASTIHVLISNDHPGSYAIVEIEAFYLIDSTRIPYAHELFTIAPNTVITKNYLASVFRAIEIQYRIIGAVPWDVVVSVIPVDSMGNALTALRVLQMEETLILTISPVA